MIKNIKLALADDHHLFRKGMEELIGDFDNMEVILSVANGNELIAKLGQLSDLPDLCLLDMNMPVMNGIDTAVEIRKRWPSVKILAVSVNDSDFSILNMLKAGAGGYILKDSQPSALMNAIKTICEKGFYYSELVSGKLLRQVINTSEEPPVTDLNENETRFLKLCCTEMTYREIANVMNLSHRTIDGYRDHLFSKLNIRSRTGLVIFALKRGIVSLDS